MNREYRQIDHATDVLSFPMLEGEFAEIAPEMLGDIVISAETAQAISEQTGSSLDSVVHLLLIHGVLHLLGFDHEADETEAALMKEKTEEILSILGHSGAEFAWYYEDPGD